MVDTPMKRQAIDEDEEWYPKENNPAKKHHSQPDSHGETEPTDMIPLATPGQPGIETTRAGAINDPRTWGKGVGDFKIVLSRGIAEMAVFAGSFPSMKVIARFTRAQLDEIIEGLPPTEAIEVAAGVIHDAWVSWSQSVVNEVSEDEAAGWEARWVDYDKLPENEKEKDRIWARRMLSLLQYESDDTEKEAARGIASFGPETVTLARKLVAMKVGREVVEVIALVQTWRNSVRGTEEEQHANGWMTRLHAGTDPDEVFLEWESLVKSKDEAGWERLGPETEE